MMLHKVEVSIFLIFSVVQMIMNICNIYVSYIHNH